jgi:phosphonopyruvate decarboxylase
MIPAGVFLDELVRFDFDLVAGVPCSFLTPWLIALNTSSKMHHVGAASEGEAVAIAAGAWLAGRKTVVFCQNSGLGNAVNPLTSLNFPFRIPTFLLVTWRGEPGLKDEPQHVLMGQITQALLDVIRVPWREFPSEARDLPEMLNAATAKMNESSLPFASVVRKDSIGGDEPPPAPHSPLHPRAGDCIDLIDDGPLPARIAALERFLAVAPERASVIATTGKCGRELFTLCDRPQHLYQVGSMGCASAMALGVALNSKSPVVVLDGDGSALMKLGNMATIGAYAPENLIHVILDNNAHDSTGGQPTSSKTVDFARAAQSCGYRSASKTDNLRGFEAAVTAAFKTPGPTLIHLQIQVGSLAPLARPSIAPHEVAQRFRKFLMDGHSSDQLDMPDGGAGTMPSPRHR